MKGIVLTAALAAGVLGLTGRADAQGIGYNYRTYVPTTGSVVAGRTAYTPWGAQTQTRFVNPIFGYGGQSAVYQDPWGNTYGELYKYNPRTGLGYTTGYYAPGPFSNPFSGYGYGYYFR